MCIWRNLGRVISCGAFFLLLGLPAASVKAGEGASREPHGQVTTVANFSQETGTYNFSGVAVASDGNIYGSASEGGKFNSGTIFRVTPSGKIKVVHAFTGGTGGYGGIRITEGSDGALYGGSGGGQSGFGFIYRLTLDGKFTVVHDLNSTEALGDMGLASDGNLYGFAFADFGMGYGGALFGVSSAGHYNLIATFDFAGYHGPSGVPLLGDDGNLYVLLQNSGTNGNGPGALASVSPEGNVTILHEFTSDEGYYAWGNLVYDASHEYMYGFSYGGQFFRFRDGDLEVLSTLSNLGTQFAPYYLVPGPDGNHFYSLFEKKVISIDLAGVVNTVAKPPGNIRGQNLSFSPAGAIYGSTFTGGANDLGFVFKVKGY